MSDTADEVDWEWSGNNYAQKTPTVQTNYFGKGITGNYDRSKSVSPGFQMTTGLHNYSIDWTADSLTWSIDGKAVRTLFKKDCDNDQHQYPQTPSRFHLGVWVAGDESKAQGVIQWAGGLTDLSRLPYTAYVKSVNLVPASKCAYFNYTDKRGSSDSIKCLNELPVSLSPVLSSTALNTLSAAPPAPSTVTNVTSSLGGLSSSSFSSNGTAGGTTSTNKATSGNVQASGGSGSVQLTTSTVFKTTIYETVTSCNSAVTNCPANSCFTILFIIEGHFLFILAGLLLAGLILAGLLLIVLEGILIEQGIRAGDVILSEDSHDVSGQVTGSQESQDSAPSASSAAASSKPPELTTSTVYSTNIYTVTSCGPEVKSCPAKSTVIATEVVVAYTTVCPVSSQGVPSGESQEQSLGNPSAPPPSSSTNTATKDGSESHSSQTINGTSPSPLASSDSAPPPSSSAVTPPKDGVQKQSSQEAPPVSPSVPPLSASSSSSAITPPKDGSGKQAEEPTPSVDTSAPPPSDGASPSSSSTIIPPNEAHAEAPSTSLTGSHDATILMEYGQHTASLYNVDTEVEASVSSSLSAPPPADTSTHASVDANPSAPSGTDAGMSSSRVAAEQGSAPPPTEKGPTSEEQAPAEPDGSDSVPAAGVVGASHSSTGLAHPVPADGATTRSTITRTTTIRLTSTRQSTSTFYSASETVMTECEPGNSGADCLTISSTTTVVASKMVTPVAFTTTNVVATTEVVDVPPADSALSSAAAQGAPGVAGTGTGTGQLPAGPKTTTLPTIAGSGRIFEMVPGVLFMLVLGVFLL
ncbi:hypothetical protein Daus18300_003180 [Diaporthe australafricana]|uniref:GH16 domain-containing protein n=1 Tax=Diaporthe australafricana TaxID=127596 RepID=A0ABR3XIA8_9PEZI